MQQLWSVACTADVCGAVDDAGLLLEAKAALGGSWDDEPYDMELQWQALALRLIQGILQLQVSSGASAACTAGMHLPASAMRGDERTLLGWLAWLLGDSWQMAIACSAPQSLSMLQGMFGSVVSGSHVNHAHQAAIQPHSPAATQPHNHTATRSHCT